MKSWLWLVLLVLCSGGENYTFAFHVLSNQLWLLTHPEGPLRLRAVSRLHLQGAFLAGCGADSRGTVPLSPRRDGRARASRGAAWLTALQESRAMWAPGMRRCRWVRVGLSMVALMLPFVGHSCQISDKHFCLTKEKENHSQKDLS